MPRSAFAHAADLFDPPDRGAARYYNDPAGFVRDCFTWEPGDAPTSYQLENLRLLHEHKRLAVRGPHGLGKTTTNAWAILWFALTRDAKGQDWKVVTTASVWRQCTDFLWPEIRKWARRLDYDVLERAPLARDEMMRTTLKLTHGHAFAAVADEPANIEGAHADQMFYVYDEAKTIPAATFDASEGAFSGAEANPNQDAFALASSTPGDKEGRFYDIHARKAGLENWHAVWIHVEQTIKEGRNSVKWLEACRALWGGTSAIFLRRCKGEFAQDEETGVIPLSHIELATERWLKLKSEGVIDALDVVELETLGVDVARSGEDKTVIAERFGHTIRHLHRSTREDIMQTAGIVSALLNAAYHPAKQPVAIVDVIGLGAGVVDRVREQSKANIVAFNASETTKRKDMSNVFEFVNKRSAAWWNLREMLDPASGLEVALPPDDTLIGDLAAPTWRVMSAGKIQVESKDDIKKRIQRSTDDGDAVVMAFWPEGGPSLKNFLENPDGFFGGPTGRSRWNYE